ncbi:MAG: ABC transporter ATP-binding protein, partial [Bacilli bacterium]
MFKKFVSYYKNHTKLFIFVLSCVLVMSIIDLIFPSASREILNNVIPNKEINKLITMGIILLGLYILRFFLSYSIGYFGHVLGIRIETDMREDLFKKLETLDYQFYDDKKTGELLANLTSHLHDLSEMSHHAPEDIFISIIMIIGSFIILSFTSFPLTLIVFVIILMMIVYSISRRRKMMASFRKVRTEQGELISKIENSLSGIYLTKAYSNEEFEINKFKEINQDFKEARSMSFKEIGLFGSGINFFTNIANLTLLVAGGLFVYYGKIDYVDLFTFFLYINFLVSPINRLSNSMETIQNGWSGFERFSAVMETKPSISNPINPIITHNFIGNIEFKNVNFNYKNIDDHVLNNFSLKIPSGSMVALVGETGVGKSTISKLIPRFYDVNSGDVLIDGINVKDYDLYTLRSAIGHVQQDVFIFWGTIKENILYGKPNASDEEVILASKRANIHDFIMSLENGYNTMTGERGIRLSGGQKQRIAIARLFLRNPSIIILDEATSALDNVTEHQIQEAFEELSKDKTSIIIAHRLTTIKNADKIIVLNKDGIEDIGTHEELLKRGGTYANMYNASQKES